MKKHVRREKASAAVVEDGGGAGSWNPARSWSPSDVVGSAMSGLAGLVEGSQSPTIPSAGEDKGEKEGRGAAGPSAGARGASRRTQVESRDDDDDGDSAAARRDGNRFQGPRGRRGRRGEGMGSPQRVRSRTLSRLPYIAEEYRSRQSQASSHQMTLSTYGVERGMDRRSSSRRGGQRKPQRVPSSVYPKMKHPVDGVDDGRDAPPAAPREMPPETPLPKAGSPAPTASASRDSPPSAVETESVQKSDREAVDREIVANDAERTVEGTIEAGWENAETREDNDAHDEETAAATATLPVSTGPWCALRGPDDEQGRALGTLLNAAWAFLDEWGDVGDARRGGGEDNASFGDGEPSVLTILTEAGGETDGGTTDGMLRGRGGKLKTKGKKIVSRISSFKSSGRSRRGRDDDAYTYAAESVVSVGRLSVRSGGRSVVNGGRSIMSGGRSIVSGGRSILSAGSRLKSGGRGLKSGSRKAIRSFGSHVKALGPARRRRSKASPGEDGCEEDQDESAAGSKNKGPQEAQGECPSPEDRDKSRQKDGDMGTSEDVGEEKATGRVKSKGRGERHGSGMDARKLKKKQRAERIKDIPSEILLPTEVMDEELYHGTGGVEDEGDRDLSALVQSMEVWKSRIADLKGRMREGRANNRKIKMPDWSACSRFNDDYFKEEQLVVLDGCNAACVGHCNRILRGDVDEERT